MDECPRGFEPHPYYFFFLIIFVLPDKTFSLSIKQETGKYRYILIFLCPFVSIFIWNSCPVHDLKVFADVSRDLAPRL